MRRLIANLTFVLSVIVIGQADAALLFDVPTDTISIIGNTTIGNAATYEGLIYFTGPYGSDGTLYNEWTDSRSDKQLWVGPNHLLGYSFPVNAPTAFQANPTIGFGAWHHAAYVYDGSQESLYLDGTQVVTRPASGLVGNYLGTQVIGAIPRDDGLGHGVRASFTGYLDWVRVSDTARYSGTTFIPPLSVPAGDANTQLLYDFTAATGGSTVPDLSGNGHTGTFGVGFATATAPQWVPDPAPEPCTFALLGVGALSLLVYAWRRQKRVA